MDDDDGDDDNNVLALKLLSD